MRIGIDVRPLQSGHKFRGIGTYTHCLLEGLSRIDWENEYFLFAQKGAPPIDFGFLHHNFKMRVIEFPQLKKSGIVSRRWYQQVSVPRTIAKAGIDVFHFTEPDPSLFCRFKKIITFHDLVPLKLANAYNQPAAIYYTTRKWAAKRAEHIIAVSENCKKDVMELLGIAEGKIRVTYLAGREIFRQTGKTEALEVVNTKYHIRNKFLLYVSGLEPRKNVEGLLEMFKKISVDSHDRYDLVIVTKEDAYYPRIVNTVQDMGLKDKVIFTGYLPPQELVWFYNAASAFVTASICEGFGLPLLEAMACGTPVVTFNNSSLPEVGGDAALLVKSGNMDELAEGILRILTDEALKKKLIEKGLKWAKKFSWQNTARQTLKVYSEVGRI